MLSGVFSDSVCVAIEFPFFSKCLSSSCGYLFRCSLCFYFWYSSEPTQETIHNIITTKQYKNDLDTKSYVLCGDCHDVSTTVFVPSRQRRVDGYVWGLCHECYLLSRFVFSSNAFVRRHFAFMKSCACMEVDVFRMFQIIRIYLFDQFVRCWIASWFGMLPECLCFPFRIH